MNLMFWLVVGLAAVDVTLVTLFYFQIRSYPRLDSRTLTCIGGGMMGFLVHACVFFQGAFLILQLASIAAICVLCRLQSLGRLPKPKPKPKAMSDEF